MSRNDTSRDAMDRTRETIDKTSQPMDTSSEAAIRPRDATDRPREETPGREDHVVRPDRAEHRVRPEDEMAMPDEYHDKHQAQARSDRHKESVDDQVIRESMDSFPASDPPSWTPERVGGPKRSHEK